MLRGRAVATILFSDIVGSTERNAELAEEWERVLTQHTQIVRGELARHGSVLFKDLRGGYLGAFPIGSVDPASAIAAGFGMVGRLRELGLHVRAGIHTGLCVLSPSDVRGGAVRVAERIMRTARPGEILVSGATRELVDGADVAFEDLGLRQLKGILRRQRVFAAVP